MKLGGAFILAALMLAGCSGAVATSSSSGAAPATPEHTSSTSAASNPATTPAVPSVEPTVVPPGTRNEDTGELIGPNAQATWDSESVAAALEVAQATTRAFARPDLPFDEWWAGLSPLLTAQGQVAYAYVLPENVPATEVTGDATVVDDTSAYVVVVAVPTDIGTYQLTLVRESAESPWLVDRLVPEERQ